MCAVVTERETPKFGDRSTREIFLHACGVHWSMLGGRVSLLAAAGFDLSLARSDGEYTFCRWLTLTLKEDAPCFGGDFFHQ